MQYFAFPFSHRYIATPFVLRPGWRSAARVPNEGRMLLELVLQEYVTPLMIEFGVKRLEKTASHFSGKLARLCCDSAHCAPAICTFRHALRCS
jgi:hypothetical protein